MAQLYARVFVQILDSSIAEDFTLRHVFEDLLKLSEDGVVDMTRQALARRLNIPPEKLNPYLDRLEKPDLASRDDEFQGRRIERLDDHRDWGWMILNWEKYDKIRKRADVAIRQARWRKNKDSTPTQSKPVAVGKEVGMPPIDHALFAAENAGVPKDFAEKVWTERMAANEVDGAGRPLTQKNWGYYVKKRWDEKQEVKRESSGRSAGKQSVAEERNSRISGADATRKRLNEEWERDQHAEAPEY